MAAVLPTRILSQGDGSGGQCTAHPWQLARSVQSQVARGRATAVAGSCVLTARSWAWEEVSADQRQMEENLTHAVQPLDTTSPVAVY